MPYIKPDSREKYDHILRDMSTIDTKGDLEYCIFKLMVHYMQSRSSRYTDLHDCCYAAMHCADEFRRRFLDKREDAACNENGDIV